MTQPLEQRLAATVATKLGCPVDFLRWVRQPNGTDVPVFRVPVEMRSRARALGLTVDLPVPPYEQRKTMREATLAVGR